MRHLAVYGVILAVVLLLCWPESPASRAMISVGHGLAGILRGGVSFVTGDGM